MILCPRCQSQNQDGAPWCQYCGLPFTAYPPQPQYPPQQQLTPQQPQYIPHPPSNYQEPAPQPEKQTFIIKEKKTSGCLIAIAVFFAIAITLILLTQKSENKTNRLADKKPAERTEIVATQNLVKQTVDAYPLLGSEYRKISDMTDIQKEPYIRELMGKEFRVIGGITEVNADGTIQIGLKNSSFMNISMVKGYPADRLSKLTKDDTIDFIGRVVETSTLLYLNVTTEFIRDTEKY